MKEVIICIVVQASQVLPLHIISKKKGIDVLLIDQSERTGGVIHSVLENGFIYEEGPKFRCYRKCRSVTFV